MTRHAKIIVLTLCLIAGFSLWSFTSWGVKAREVSTALAPLRQIVGAQANTNPLATRALSSAPIAASNASILSALNPVFQSGTKVDTPDPVIAGNLLTYTITATNPGPSAALNYRIIDPLPLGTVFISAVASPGASLTTPAVGANGTVTAQWDAAGGTPAGLTPSGVTRTLTIVVRVCPDFQQILGLTNAQMCVPNLTNTATITSDTPGTPDTATALTTVQAQADLSLSKTGSPNPVTLGQDITYTLTFANAGPSNANGVVVTDTLPAGFTVVSTSTTVPGTIFSSSTLNGVTTVTANLGVLGAANQCTLTRPTSGTITIVAHVPDNFFGTTAVNSAVISSTNCLPETAGMLANNTDAFEVSVIARPVGPGIVLPASTVVNDQKAGSVLIYNIYISNPASVNTQNTEINITNTDTTRSVAVHLFFMDGTTCSPADAFLCLTPNQTASFLASDFDPGTTGYIVAVASDPVTGCPINFNFLVGSEYVKFTTGHRARLGAEAISALYSNAALPGCVGTSLTATLNFDGVSYSNIPRVLAVDSIPSRADGNDTLLIVNRIGGNLSSGAATLSILFGLLFDDQENSVSFNFPSQLCQLRSSLTNNFPRAPFRLETLIPTGRTGWMKFYSQADIGILGAVINFNPNAGFGASNGGTNLHKLTLSASASYTIPILPPSCGTF